MDQITAERKYFTKRIVELLDKMDNSDFAFIKQIFILVKIHVEKKGQKVKV